MTINNDETRNVSQLDLDRTSGSRPIGDAATTSSTSVNQTSANDSIALSTSSDLVQQALSFRSDGTGRPDPAIAAARPKQSVSGGRGKP